MRKVIYWLYEQFYGPLSWAYDAGVWLLSGGMWYRWAFVAERFVEHDPVLEVGCGRGHLLRRLAESGCEVIGLDSSPQMAAAARRKLRQIDGKANVIEGTAQAIPLDDASVGTIISTFSSAFIHDERTWREFARVLRPGGRCIVISGVGHSGRPPLRLAILYLMALLKGSFSRSSPKQELRFSTELFGKQRKEILPVGPTVVAAFILDKQTQE